MKIAIIPGDGIGPELAGEVKKLIDIINSHFKSGIEYQDFPYGGRHFARHRESVPDDFLRELKQNYRGVFIAALGDPTVYSQQYVSEIAGRIIHHLELIVVEKPLYLFNPDLARVKNGFQHLTVFRDSIEGLEVTGGFRLRTHSSEELASDTHIYDERNVTRLIEGILDAGDGKIPPIPLVLRKALYPNTHRLWEKAYLSVMKDRNMHPRVLEIPAFIHSFLEEPSRFQAILSPGLTGELLCEVLGEFVGGKAFTTTFFSNLDGKFLCLPDIGPQNAMAGAGRIAPFSAFYSLALIYRRLNLVIPSKIILHAIGKAFENKWLPPDLGGSMTTEMIGDFVASYIDEQLNTHQESIKRI